MKTLNGVFTRGKKMTKTPELLPCPFCGGPADFQENECIGYAYCIQCLAKTDEFYSLRNNNWKEDAARDWNSRTQCPECEKKKKAIEHISFHLEMVLCAMQAAYVEMCNTGADNAMRWIENTLDGPGLIPDVPKGITAQEFFDKEMAELESRMRNETN